MNAPTPQNLASQSDVAPESLANPVRVRIDNCYADGFEQENLLWLSGPESDLESWWEDVVFPETGTGRSGEAIYEATIVAAPHNPGLLGEHYEWGG